MFERFSDRARRVVALAEVEARALGHQHLGTEHLLLGVLAEAHSAAAEALDGAGATLFGARQKVAEAIGRRPPPATPGEELGLTARAKRALGRAARFSLQHRDPYVEPEHVLLGVLDVEGTAGQVLRGLGVDVGRLRDGLARRSPALGAAPDDEAESPGPAPPASTGVEADEAGLQSDAASPRCPACGAPLAGGLSSRILTARQEGGGTRDLMVTFCTRCGSAFAAAPC